VAACGGPEARPATVDLGAPRAPAVVVGQGAPRASSGTTPAAPPKIAWETSEPAARQRAMRAGMPMIVWGRADWAAAALEMERKVWTDPEVALAARPFVALRLDLTAAEGDAELYAQHYGIRAMPTTVLVDGSGVRAAVLEGHVDAAKLVAALKKVAE
jgi:thiol:disulfide interchange protein